MMIKQKKPWNALILAFGFMGTFLFLGGIPEQAEAAVRRMAIISSHFEISTSSPSIEDGRLIVAVRTTARPTDGPTDVGASDGHFNFWGDIGSIRRPRRGIRKFEVLLEGLALNTRYRLIVRFDDGTEGVAYFWTPRVFRGGGGSLGSLRSSQAPFIQEDSEPMVPILP